MTISPFDYLNSINNSKKDIMTDDIDEKAYAPFVVNRSLSYFRDTVLFANEMNRLPELDNRLQYDFLRLLVRKKKRFSKWAKADTKNLANIQLIKTVYGYNEDKAREVLPLFDEASLDFLRKKYSKGGKNP